MSDTKISALTALTGANVDAAADVLPIVDTSVTTTKKILVSELAIALGLPAGVMVPYAGTAAPSGWLLCYGQVVAQATYPSLYTVLGTTYGSDAGGNFTLPDLRGRIVAGQDDMGGSSANRLTNQTGGLDGDTLGATGGAETHTLTEAQMPSHTHGLTRGNALGSGGDFPDGNAVGATATDATGGGTAHNNVQPTIILNYIIKF